MGRGYKVYIMAPHPLKFQHHVSQGFKGDFVSFPKMTDGIVLAEYTLETTIAEKDSP